MKRLSNRNDATVQTGTASEAFINVQRRGLSAEMIMSTGIGNHEFSTNYRNIYKPDLAICPYCGFDSCEADHCDVGIGMVQCGPYYCPQCRASEISSLDTRELTEKEKETGWFKPDSPVSDVANTVNGHLVNHKEAKQAYDIGLLDVKKSDREAS